MHIPKNPMDKKIYGIGIKQKFILLQHQSGCADINDYIQSLLDQIDKKDIQYNAMKKIGEQNEQTNSDA